VEGCAVTAGEPQDLGATMSSCLPVVLHSAKMRYDNAPGLSILHRHSGLVDDFNQNVTLGNMVIPRNLCTGNGEQTKF
jgi:hypothetical protein